MDLLERHAKLTKRIVHPFSRTITLIDPEDNEYPDILGIFNDVEQGLKMDDIENPIGEKSNIYIDRDSLQTETGEIKPVEGWRLTGSPNDYDSEKTYYIEIDKSDRQLPGITLKLSTIKPTATKWDSEV